MTSRTERTRILIIEDDPAVRDTVARALRRAGFEPLEAASGKGGLERARREVPDLVVLDLNLPDQDGLQVCCQLRTFYDRPILILSVRAETLDRISSFRLGVDDYLTKPFSPTELVLRVQAILRRYRGERSTRRLEVEAPEPGGPALSLDLPARRAWLGEEELSLTPKEFDLLRVLAEHRGDVLSPEQLTNLIWNSEYLGEVSSIPVLIRRLRSKIERDPANPRWIQTVWGVGYRFAG